jgi:hypothetical protein
MAWDEDWPIPKPVPHNGSGCGGAIVLIFIIAVFANSISNTNSEQVSETDVEQVSETDVEQVSESDVEQVSETEIYPEERYETISETESEKIIKRYNDGWFQSDVNNTYNWMEYKNNDSSISYIFTLQKEDDNYFYLRSEDRDILLAIPKDYGMSYIWNEQSQTFNEFTIIY